MFKCTECGTEYKVKPEYCDCGNNTFEEIKVKPRPAVKKKEEIPKIDNTPEIQYQRPEAKKEFSETERLKSTFDPISSGIFLFCIILALVTIFFIGNPDKKNTKPPEKKETNIMQNINIPPVDSFWNNSVKGVVSDAVETPAINQPVTPQKQTQPEIPQPISPQSVQKQLIYVHDNTALPPQRTAQPRNSSKSQTASKQKAAPQKKNTVKKSANIPVKQNSARTSSPFSALTSKIQNSISFNNNNNTNISPAPAPQKKTTPIPSPKPSVPAPKATVPARVTPTAPKPSAVSQTNSAAAKQELANYKVSLRNTIGRKIDFTKVIGDGDCAITFKIASNGRLTNRTFAKQSSNITLNDAVYAAMMSTPSFNAPPSAYKNETLRLNVKFYNGNFSINLN